MRLIIVLSAAVCLTVAGCHTWQVQPGPGNGAALAAADSTKPVRLTLNSGAVIELSSPRMVDDSVVGTSHLTGQRVAFAVADVQSVARRQVSAGRTALATGGVILVGVAIVGILAAAALGGVMGGM